MIPKDHPQVVFKELLESIPSELLWVQGDYALTLKRIVEGEMPKPPVENDDTPKLF